MPHSQSRLRERLRGRVGQRAAQRSERNADQCPPHAAVHVLAPVAQFRHFLLKTSAGGASSETLKTRSLFHQPPFCQTKTPPASGGVLQTRTDMRFRSPFSGPW